MRILDHWAAVAWSEVFQQLDPRTGRSTKARDSQPCTEDVVQVLLLSSVIFALAGDAHPQRVAIEVQARIRVADDNRSVIDAEKQFIVSLVPPRIALAQGKLENFEKVTVWVTKIKGTDACRVLDVTRQ